MTQTYYFGRDCLGNAPHAVTAKARAIADSILACLDASTP